MTSQFTLLETFPRNSPFPVDGPDEDLLGVDEMAGFVCNGFVKLDKVVPDQLNTRVLSAMNAYHGDGFKFWLSSAEIREVFELPAIRGALRSLLGPEPVYNHSYLHIVPAYHQEAQKWHADSVFDTRPLVFDILVFYFPHDTPDEMGPTLVLPGSHLRGIRYGSIAHLKNVVGQQRLACEAGTVVFAHADIWHAAQPNATPRARYMFKVRLQLVPGENQRGFFNIAGYDDPDLLERIFRDFLS